MARAIIITGMHRSGTSLVSSLLQRAGIHIGEKLLEANSANPRGYFEDVDFYEFHEHLLHRRGQSYLHVDGDFSFEPSADEIERAKALVGARTHRAVWGWKDPRTALFLNFWNQILPDGRFVFVYRHPIEVLLSLLRRGEFDNYPLLMSGLTAWQVYNASIFRFCREHRERCLLVHIDGVVKDTSRFVELLRERVQLRIEVASAELKRICHPEELRKTAISGGFATILGKLQPGLLELYRQLDSEADMPSVPSDGDSAEPNTLSMLSQIVERTEAPLSEALRQSLLQTVAWMLAPELTDRMFERFHHSAKHSQQQIDAIWMHCQELERNKTALRQEFGYLQDLNARQSAELAQQAERVKALAERVESLKGELKCIHETYLWKMTESVRKLKGRWKKAA